MSGSMQPMPQMTQGPMQMPQAMQNSLPQQVMPQQASPQSQSGFGGSTINYQPPPMSSAPIPPPMGGPTSESPGIRELAKAAGKKGKGAQPKLTPAEMARLGRYGDAVVAHLTPGEIAVPPEVQTPQVQQTLSHAFQQAGVSPQQFVAGSPQSSINPHTGAPEYSFWSAVLPILGAIGGSFIPGVGTSVGMGLGGAAGGGLGALADKSSPTQALLSVLGGGLGGYVGGGGIGDVFGSAAAAESAANPTAMAASAAAPSELPGASFGVGVNPEFLGTAPQTAGSAAAAAAQQVSNPTNAITNSLWDSIKAAPWKGAMLAGGGATLAGMLAPPPTQSSAAPPGFNNPMTPLNRNYNSMLGNSNASYPSFAGYNPYQSVTGGGYNFFAPRG